MLNEAETLAKLIDPAWWPISRDSTKAKSGFDDPLLIQIPAGCF